MPIEWSAENSEFHLRNDRVSYVGRLLESHGLGHLYFGPALAGGRSYSHIEPGAFYGYSNRLGDPVALECPTAGSGDYRVPAFVVEQPDGSTVLDLKYAGHRIVPGKPALPGLPSTYTEVGGEAETLEVTLADQIAGLEARLLYTIYKDRPLVVRSARLVNTGAKTLIVRCAMSLMLDLPDSGWQFITLDGEWGRECHVTRRDLRPGSQSVSSVRGISGHQHNPWVALARPSTTEEFGEAIGAGLLYSGNFLAEAEVEPFGTARLRMGINPATFAWVLEPKGEFATPEAVLAYSSGGLDELSGAFHSLYRERLARGRWRDRPRPIVINNWEATFFDFDEAKIVEIATAAAGLGVEMFVLDDGWFGHRDDDTTSLGDWQVDRRKLPGGLESLARKVEALGMSFGLWIEPEMVSRRSNLFGEHPEWAIGIPTRPRSEGRTQYVLDMGRPEVVDHLFETISAVLGSAPISYVKWDMNRSITEPFGGTLPAWRQGEFFHRYVLGVYSLYERLTSAFPGVLFESCSSGGGRFDAGLLAFAPQAWTSDDTDAIERLAIQWGTSYAYPLSAMSAHVSAVPNIQTGRIEPIATRAAVAFFGVFGYELDPRELTDDERTEIAGQVAFYKRHRELLQFGRFHRLRGPFDGDGHETAWLTVAEDRRKAVAAHYQVLAGPNPGPRRLRLRGLDPALRYRVTEWPAGAPPRDDVRPVNVLGGDELMSAGLLLWRARGGKDTMGDFQARVFVLEAEES